MYFCTIQDFFSTTYEGFLKGLFFPTLEWNSLKSLKNSIPLQRASSTGYDQTKKELFVFKSNA